MKKEKLDPLLLDKDTIAKLNMEQLAYILGGKDECSQFEWCCRYGGSSPVPVSTGCGAGGSTCATNTTMG